MVSVIRVLMDGITERLGWMLTRPVRDRRMRVELSEKKWRLPMFDRKVCGQVYTRTLGGFLSSIGGGTDSHPGEWVRGFCMVGES